MSESPWLGVWGRRNFATFVPSKVGLWLVMFLITKKYRNPKDKIQNIKILNFKHLLLFI
jgi:hypothetical protein